MKRNSEVENDIKEMTLPINCSSTNPIEETIPPELNSELVDNQKDNAAITDLIVPQTPFETKTELLA